MLVTSETPLHCLVEKSFEKMEHMEQTMIGMRNVSASLAEKVSILAVPKVCNAAVQVILRITAKEHKEEYGNSTWFAELSVDDGAALAKCRKDAPSLASAPEWTTLCRKLDTLVDKRNASVHFATTPLLDTEVAECVKFIDEHMRARCPTECAVLESYDAIKAAFGHRFPPQPTRRSSRRRR